MHVTEMKNENRELYSELTDLIVITSTYILRIVTIQKHCTSY